jgi:hypothetical protein
VPLELFFVTPSGEKNCVFKIKKMGEFWIFVPNVNLTNCSKFFDITQFKKIKIKIPLSQT